jgi:hypothetical protein
MNCVEATRVSSPLDAPVNPAASLMNLSPFLQLLKAGTEVSVGTDTKALSRTISGFSCDAPMVPGRHRGSAAESEETASNRRRGCSTGAGTHAWVSLRARWRESWCEAFL